MAGSAAATRRPRRSAASAKGKENASMVVGTVLHNISSSGRDVFIMAHLASDGPTDETKEPAAGRRRSAAKSRSRVSEEAPKDGA